MKKIILKERYQDLLDNYESLKKYSDQQSNTIRELRDLAKKSNRLSEDYKYKLIKHTDLTLDEIMNLTEDEIDAKLMRAIQNKACT